MKKGKPIFEEERLFLNERLGIDLPTDCWRDSKKIYLDCTCDKPIYEFKLLDEKDTYIKKIKSYDKETKKFYDDTQEIQQRKMVINKDNSKLFTDYKQKKITDLIELYSDEINELEKHSVDFLTNYLLEHNEFEQIVNAHSSGKDSCVSLHIFNLALEEIKKINIDKYNTINDKWIINFANTTNDTGYTYKFIKSLDRVNYMNPDKGLLPWIREDKKYIHPTALVRNCCSTYKEGQLIKHFDKNKFILMITGVRKYESVKRGSYEEIMDHENRIKIHGKDTLPEKWTNIAPICNWEDKHIWLHIIRENIKFNYMYRLGFNRIGCLNCPYQTDYIDLLTEWYFTKSKHRWDEMLNISYDTYETWNRLKWTRYEYIDLGKWKNGTGFEYEITNKKMTDERVKELSKRKGCTEDIAKKFWDKTCTCCGKKMNPSEISMSLKLLGRESDKLCKTCLCDHIGIDKNTYKQKQIEFTNSECTLF